MKEYYRDFWEDALDYAEISANYEFKWRKPDFTAWEAHVKRLSLLSEKRREDIQHIFIPPERLFLTKPLTSEQRSQVDAKESLRSAQIGLQLQKKIAQVEINESFEPLVCLRTVSQNNSLNWKFSERGFHDACGEWAGRSRVFWVRKTFAQRLIDMTKRLREIGLTFFFEDAFRPIGVQEGLVARRIDSIRKQHPRWQPDQVHQEASSKTAITPRLASHKAGAAVDVRLLSLSSEEFLNIGHEYAEGGALVQLNSPFVTQEQWQNRQILFVAAILCDVAMYPGEDWHLSFGDNLASTILKTRSAARYGPIRTFDKPTGRILETYGPKELDEMFL